MVQFFPAEDVQALAETIIHLYRHPERRALLASHSDRFNETYSWEQIAAQYCALVLSLWS